MLGGIRASRGLVAHAARMPRALASFQSSFITSPSHTLPTFSTTCHVQAVGKGAGVKDAMEDALSKDKVRTLTRALQGDSRAKISVEDYLGACATQGIDQEEGRSILKKLHDAGVVMHYEDVEELNRWVYTKPEETMAAFTRVLDPTGVEHTRFYTERKAELDRLNEQLKPLLAKKESMVSRARKRADTLINLGVAYVIAQGAVVARLTWWELSWDIMEPVTYMLTFSTAALGLIYFARLRRDWTYESLHDHLTEGRLRKIQAKENWNEEEFEALMEQIVEIETELLDPQIGYLNHKAKKALDGAHGAEKKVPLYSDFK